MKNTLAKRWSQRTKSGWMTRKSVMSQGGVRGKTDRKGTEMQKDEAISKSVSPTDVRDIELSPSVPLHAAQ